jgi:hypothetical protein
MSDAEIVGSKYLRGQWSRLRCIRHAYAFTHDQYKIYKYIEKLLCIELEYFLYRFEVFIEVMNDASFYRRNPRARIILTHFQV